jgi:hypothetical protein
MDWRKAIQLGKGLENPWDYKTVPSWAHLMDLQRFRRLKNFQSQVVLSSWKARQAIEAEQIGVSTWYRRISAR